MRRPCTWRLFEATGLTRDDIAAALKKLDLRPDNRPKRPADEPLLVLPYPGGRHPRIGFLDGALRPQRETKVSVFTRRPCPARLLAPKEKAEFRRLDAVGWREEQVSAPKAAPRPDAAGRPGLGPQ